MAENTAMQARRHALTDIVQFFFSPGCEQPLRDNEPVLYDIT